jgi:predicted ester cyclase
MTSATPLNEAEHARVMELWFTEGWTGDEQLADQIFDDRFCNNGIVVGPAGPKRNIRNRLIGFPDLTSVAEELIAAEHKAILRLRWTGTHTGPYLGIAPTGKRVDVRGMTIWRFKDGKVVEDWTVGHIPLAIFGIEIPAPIPAQPPSHPTALPPAAKTQ